MPGDDIGRQDVEALLEVRHELGTSYDAALVDSFAERIEKAVAERVDAQVAERHRVAKRETDRDSQAMVLGIVSLGTGIPITAVAGGIADLPGMLVAWAGIVGVNVAYAVRNRFRR